MNEFAYRIEIPQSYADNDGYMKHCIESARRSLGDAVASTLIENEGEVFTFSLDRIERSQEDCVDDHYPHSRRIDYRLTQAAVRHHDIVLHHAPPLPRFVEMTVGELSYTPVLKLVAAVLRRLPWYYKNVDKDIREARRII